MIEVVPNMSLVRQMRSVGHLRNKLDGRDAKVAGIGGFLKGETARPEVNYSNFVDRVRDQGVSSACVGFGITRMAHIRAQINLSTIKHGNPYYAYAGGRMRDNMAPERSIEDGGSYPREVAKFVNEFGIVDEPKWSTDYADINKKPDWTALEDGITHTVEQYRWIETYSTFQRVEQMKMALTAGYPLGIAIAVDAGFDDCHSSTPIGAPYMETVRGGHYMACIGYWSKADPWSTRFLVVNSWGTSWGDVGYGWLSVDRVIHPTTEDIMALEIAPT